jgi:hypothetical protein
MDARLALAGLGLFVLLCPSASLGQSMPVTAKERITDEVVQNGKVIGGHTREGVWFRNSAGSILDQWTTIDGKAAVGQMARARLADNEHDIHYQLDYTEHQAYIDPIPMPKTTITEIPGRGQKMLGARISAGNCLYLVPDIPSGC